MTVSAQRTAGKTVALVGNPNTGKTTLFNAFTGLSQKVGNYAGVTVDSLKGGLALSNGDSVDLLDLPGIYSLAAQSVDQRIAVDILFGRQQGIAPLDAVLAVVDASNLARNLYLISQIIETEVPMVIALNMSDLAKSRGIDVNADQLASRLGVPVVPISARKKEGIDRLTTAIESVLDGGGSGVARTRPPIPDNVREQQSRLAELFAGEDRGRNRAEALRGLIDQGGYEEERILNLKGPGFATTLEEMRQQIGADRPLTALESELRYHWIEDLMNGSVLQPARLMWRRSDAIDRVLTHRLFGFLVLLLVSSQVFQAIFSWSAPLMDRIVAIFGVVGIWVAGVVPPGALQSMLVDGVVAGVGGVLVFLPQIAVLFLFISILEDCGYMARAALLLDKTLTRVGLSGKSFIPLLSSFACAVPAIMATRTIEDRRDRFTTILVAPLMSCSARLPVYIIMVAAFIPDRPFIGQWFGLQAFTLFAMYMVGTLVAIPVAWLLKKTLLKGEAPPFLMELPSYKWPRPQLVFRRVYDNCKEFVVRAGSIILTATIVMWALAYFPRSASTIEEFESRRQRITAELPAGQARDLALAPLDKEQAAALLQGSYLGQAGQFIEPAVRPLGWDWRIGMATLAAFPAREVVISVLGTVFSLGSAHDETSEDLRHALQSAVWADGTPVFTVPSALSIMVFFALCAQCMSTLAVIQRETRSWTMAGVTFLYMTVLAYVGALATFQLTTWLGWGI
jgi:ferrous iron transport protein B